jgi:predicted Fe-Mo cluster-binding NifX family protein
MKVAIPMYEGRISPRFGFIQNILLADIGEKGVLYREILPIECGRLVHEIPEMLHDQGVRVLLTGGINLHFQNLFKALGIEVIWGLIGTPEEAVDAFVSGQVVPGMGRCASSGRHRRRGTGPSRG